MVIAFPGESAEYRAARDRLLQQEVELRRAMEAVAATRRRLPPGGIVTQDYVFQTHASQRINLAAAGKAPIEHILTFAAERGWRHLRLLSTAGTSYNRDYWAETADGEQQPMLNVFHRDGDTIRHFWSSELFTHPKTRGKTSATSAPLSRYGTSSTSPLRDAQPTGTSS
jgi:predicted dithiol-disulfide oxidoreductase (DUF899 family)